MVNFKIVGAIIRISNRIAFVVCAINYISLACWARINFFKHNGVNMFQLFIIEKLVEENENVNAKENAIAGEK